MRTVSLGTDILTSSGAPLGDGTIFLSTQMLLGDGIIIGDRIIIGDGIIVGDSRLQAQSTMTRGDDTTALR